MGANVGDFTDKCIPIGKHLEIYEGEYYTVCEVFESDGKEYYSLEERPFKIRYGSRRFMPLSDKDEMEYADELNIATTEV